MPDTLVVESSSLAWLRYSDRTNALDVCFRNGGIYRFLEVPADCYQELLAARSKGKFFNQNIRNRFGYKLLASFREIK